VTEWTGITTMKKNRIGYFLKEGVHSIFSHRLMSFASVCVIIACLLIMGTFSVLALNVSNIISNLEAENQILAYVDDTLTDTQARNLESRLMSVANVDRVEFVSRDEAMEDFVANYDEALFEGLDSSVLRHRYVIYMDDIADMAQTQETLESIEGIADVNAHLEIAQGFIRLRNIVSAVSILLAGVLLVVSLFIVANTIKLTTFERREEIAIMRMVGATSSFIRGPFVVEGLILGTIGSVTAYLAQWGLYKLVENSLVGSGGLSFIRVIDFSVLAIPMLIVFVGVGFAVGAMGSSMAIKNYLKV